ncbi:hypothetical protein V6N11_004311 [Hibiscus sabdariffa]|uniref:Uncharacterized protein n=2 Tax=Hibiscus sabdariffa TaxID=183260 RepID=A0ABR2AHD0_9ROSI
MVSPFDEWFKANLRVKPRSMTPPFDWSMRFSIYCWLLWKTRCCVILGGDQITRRDIVDKGKRLIEEYERVYYPDRGKEKPLLGVTSHWNGPPSGWFKGNVDVTDGMVFAMPSATVATMMEEEQVYWEESEGRIRDA